MPQTRSVGQTAKRVVLEFLKQTEQARSGEVRDVLEDNDYSYQPSVVLNNLIEDGLVEKDESGLYFITDEGMNHQFDEDDEGGNQGGRGNRSNHGRSQGRQSQGQAQGRSRNQDDDRGQGQSRLQSRQQFRNRSNNQDFQSLVECLQRLEEINQEEKELILAVQDHPMFQMFMQMAGNMGQGMNRGQSQGRQGRSRQDDDRGGRNQSQGRSQSRSRDYEDEGNDNNDRERNDRGQFSGGGRNDD